ncbi:predicted protein [Naegleria gruberi]|uniref:Predicted protein n=1 Tax=Naegleria gruberi TaxID=5762 RepID=D2V6L9_NAEGR|nr:uncharacterized protein NAEGRDRAFT_64488 [Naegleria gruberi]EFC47465.1 predicted protein [Naegleria gruberi]|eukprot:XP_002680209.1 predicted protein [Naegleria gruberi strain NEG-M]
MSTSNNSNSSIFVRLFEKLYSMLTSPFRWIWSKVVPSSNSSSSSLGKTSLDDRYAGVASQNPGKTVIEYPTLPVHELPKIYDEKAGSSFVKDFDIELDSSEEILKFFNEFGVVVFRNVLNEEEVDRSLDDVWNILEKEEHMKPNDPETWKKGSRMGIVGNDVYWTRVGMENRQNEKLVKCFELVYGMDRSKLWTSFDRIGVLKPTVDVPVPYNDSNSLPKSRQLSEMPSETSLVQKKELKTESQWLHWDLNPYYCLGEYPAQAEDENDNKQIIGSNPDYYFIVENNSNYEVIRLQGILAISETREQDGGFVCVPGFVQHVKEYAEKLRDYKPGPRCTFLSVRKEDPLISQTQKVPVRKGSLIIFNSLLPHANFPNSSDRFRVCQYIKMVPKKGSEEFQRLRATMVHDLMSQDFVPNEIGKEVFGFNLLDKYKQQ